MKKMIFLLSIIGILITQGFTQTAADAIRLRAYETGFGTRTMAMGLNGVASANDYSAIYWNPAGLASLKANELFFDTSFMRFDNNARFAGSTVDSETDFSRLRSAGLAMKLPTSRGSMVLALGYHFVRDFDDYLYFSGFNELSNGLQFELDDGSGNFRWYDFDRHLTQSEEVSDAGGLHQWSFGGGVALSPNFDVGVAANYWRGKDEYRMQFRQEDSDDRYNLFPADFHSYQLTNNLITDYSAFGVKLGGMFKPNRALRVGLAMEFPVTFTLTEQYASSDQLEFDDGYIDSYDYGSGEWQYKVRTPYRFDAGVVVQNRLIRLSGAVTYQDWTQTRFKVPDNAPLDADYSDLLDQNRRIQENYRETINYHLGGEIYFPGSSFFLRGGYAVYPSPLKDAASDMDRVYYTGGIGLKLWRDSRLDFSYLRGSWTRETEDDYTPGGTLEEVTEHRILVGLRYAF